jgi:tetratricopeptide (TPR) repeat protein
MASILGIFCAANFGLRTLEAPSIARGKCDILRNASCRDITRKALDTRKPPYAMKKRRPSIPQPRRAVSTRQRGATAPGQAANLHAALAMHQRGLLNQAEAIYKEILQSQPGNFDALQLLATIAAQRGNFALAVEWFDKAVEIDSSDARTHYNRGVALGSLGRFDEALKSCDRALKINPGYAEAYNNRGNALGGLKRFDEALESFDRALRIKPDYAEAHNNRGNALRDLRRLDEALESYDRALTINPGYAEAYNNRGVALGGLKRFDEALESCDRALRIRPDYAEAHNNRGIALRGLKRFEEALASFDRALTINPDYVEALSNRGVALRGRARFDEAVESFDRALSINPGYVEAHNNRGVALCGLKRFDEALQSYDRALGIKPDYLKAHINRGNALGYLKRLDEAIESYDHALSISPDDADAHWNLSVLRLLKRDFARGWEGYEWGWKNKARGPKKIILAQEWDGDDLQGSLVVLPEQGIGDQIFYAGMLNDLRSHAQSITVCVDDRLVKLYQRSFPAMSVVSANALEADNRFDAQVYMASLGRFFRQSAGGFENVAVPYLRACPERVRKLRSQIQNAGRLICGLSWVSKNLDIGLDKSIKLDDLAPILDLPRIDFVDLQYGDTSKEQAELYAARGLKLTRVAEIDNFSDIDGLAALIEACDIIVTVSNTTAHLAAALGKPVLVMLPFSPGLLWYWHLDSKDSVWYPGARLFRQHRIGDWAGVIQRVREELVCWSER